MTVLPVLDRVTPAERRDALVAFATLLAVMAGYTILETARDALFLASIPADRLPFAYLAVAVVAFAVTAALDRLGSAHRREALAGWLVFSAGLTAAFHAFLPRGHTLALYALYAWGGVLTTVVLVEFWGILASRFNVVQAKRVFPLVAAGSVAGALLGTGLAGVLTAVVSARHLLLFSAAFLLIASGLPLLLRVGDAPGREPRGRDAAGRGAASRGLRVLAEPYARRVAALVVLSTVTLTVVDFVFKATVAESVPADELGAFFARVYFGLNVLSLLAQVLVVRGAVRTLTVTGALAVLPTLLAAAALTTPVVGVLGGALLMKAADGGLRHSLHRTASELLYVPMSSRVRAAVKRFGDVVGQRGGQALASLLILALLAAGAGRAVQGGVVAGLAALWVLLAVRLRASYLDLFRSTLRDEARRSRFGFPDLDQSSLENVVATLNSLNDGEVRAAMEVLASQGRARLVPALILYHPSAEVVVDALDLLSAHERGDIVPIADRLLDGGPPRVRAAALRARVRLGAGEDLLRRFVDDDCPDVRATALVGLAAGAAEHADAPLRDLEALRRTGDVTARVAIARAIAHRPSATLCDLVLRLSEDPALEVQRAALDAIRAHPDPRYLDRLVEMLSVRVLRPDAREALVALGDIAFRRIAATLADAEVPSAIRRHAPRTLMRFDPEDAAPVLVERFEVETDRVVRHKILRALAHLRDREPDLALPVGTLRRFQREALVRALEFRDYRTALERDARQRPEVRTRFHGLLVRLLRDRERVEVDEVFRLLALMAPGEDVEAIQRGLSSPRRDVRASSTELLGALLDPPVRDPFVDLVEDPDGRTAIRAAQGLYPVRALDYEEVVRRMLSHPSEGLRGLAVYQAGVLGLRSLLPDIRAMSDDDRGGLLSEALRRVEGELGSRAPVSAE